MNITGVPRYDCFNPQGNRFVVTTYMGEADFWASLGYVVFDYHFCTH